MEIKARFFFLQLQKHRLHFYRSEADCKPTIIITPNGSDLNLFVVRWVWVWEMETSILECMQCFRSPRRGRAANCVITTREGWQSSNFPSWSSHTHRESHHAKESGKEVERRTRLCNVCKHVTGSLYFALALFSRACDAHMYIHTMVICCI